MSSTLNKVGFFKLQTLDNYFNNEGGSYYSFCRDVVYQFGFHLLKGVRCSSVVRAFAHGAMGHQIDPSWGGPIELFLVPASAP